ncbi:flagellar assembly protein FliX [Craurococcus roseus]
MRGVSGVSKGGAAGPARGNGAARRSAGGFSVGGPGGAEALGAAAPAPDGIGAAAAVGLSLLAAQEGGGRGAGRDAAARRRVASILDELNGLQAELLGRRVDPARLTRLAALGEGEEGTDAGLRDAVRAVALRARIELARRTMDPSASRTAAVR